MRERRLKNWFWSAGIFLFIVGVGAWTWWSVQPLAKLKLADGTELRLDAVNHGKEAVGGDVVRRPLEMQDRVDEGAAQPVPGVYV